MRQHVKECETCPPRSLSQVPFIPSPDEDNHIATCAQRHAHTQAQPLSDHTPSPIRNS